MSVYFSLNAFDSELSARTTPEEWKRILELRDHPRFLDGLARNGELMPPYFADNVILNKVVTEAWRFEMLVYLLHLYDTRDPADPRSGLTLSNLQKLCARMDCASPGRVLAILGIMRLGGYLHSERSEADSRLKYLAPSPAFIGVVEGWSRRVCQIVDAITPDADLAVSHATHPRLGWEMRRFGAEGLIAGWKLLDPFPEVVHFVMRDGGWMLLATCVARALAPSRGLEIAPVSLDLRAFAPRFGVSRSHLRRVLESAHREGLLLAPPRDGADIRLAPRLVASYLACFASEYANYRLWGLEAKRALGLGGG